MPDRQTSRIGRRDLLKESPRSRATNDDTPTEVQDVETNMIAVSMNIVGPSTVVTTVDAGAKDIVIGDLVGTCSGQDLLVDCVRRPAHLTLLSAPCEARA